MKTGTGRRAAAFFLLLTLLFGASFCLRASAAPSGGASSGDASGDTSGDAGGNASGDADGEYPLPQPDVPEGELPAMPSDGCVLLYNLDSRSLMYNYGGERRLYPASTVKLMTALTAYDTLKDRLEESVTVPPEVVRLATGVSMELRTNERLTVRQLFAGLLIGGANDAAITLALECSGDVDVFVAKMNEKAASLGMTDTAYVNVTGIDHVSAYTTGRDVLTLAEAVYGVEFFRELAALPLYEMPATNQHAARTIHTRNYFLSRRIYPYYFQPDVTGMNAGSTAMGGNCLVATATLGNVPYLCVVLGAGESAGSWEEQPVKLNDSYGIAEKMFAWGVKNFEYRTVVSTMQVYGEVAVELSGGNDFVTAVPVESLQIFLPIDAKTEEYALLETKMYYTTLTAPVTEGTELGELAVRDPAGNLLAQTTLVAKNGIYLNQWRYLGAKILGVVRTRAFAVGVGIFGFVCLTGVLVTARMRYLRARRAIYRERER